MKYCVQVIKACITDDEEYDWGKVGIKIGKNERPRHHKGDEIVIELPDMEFVKKDENDTSGYLVSVSEENVVMPRYYDFITSKLNAFRGEKGKIFQLGELNLLNLFRFTTGQSPLQKIQQKIWCHLLSNMLGIN